MARFCSGEAAAFELLYKRHAAPVYAFLARLVRDRSRAEDLTQITFLSVVRARSRFVPGSRFTPWLYAIAVNAARDAGRRKERRPEELTRDGMLPSAESQTTQPMVRDPGLERQVREALAQLPAAHREAVVLHRFQGLSFAEIAEALGTTVGAAKVRAHRGYERLRALLKGLEDSA